MLVERCPCGTSSSRITSEFGRSRGMLNRKTIFGRETINYFTLFRSITTINDYLVPKTMNFIFLLFFYYFFIILFFYFVHTNTYVNNYES